MAQESAARSSSNPEPDDLLEVLAGPLEYYCAGLLKIATKKGKLVPFKLNRSQAFLHAVLEKQLEQTRRVRALVLKSRKVGISTYVAARYFRRTHALQDQTVLIQSHTAPSMTTLFNVAKRFYNHLPGNLRPMIGLWNKETITFPGLRNQYLVSTAGGTGSNRGDTIQLFHGSECAFWPNADDHLKGALQTVADVDSTEIILESTANGVGGMFYDMWIKAERGEGKFIPIFIPWFWDDDCAMQPPISWEPVGEELKLKELYNLSLAQIFWAHLKNIELGGDTGKFCWSFKQEYPSDANEAFQTTGGDGIISSDLVTSARKAIHLVSTEYDARLLGVDTARNVSEHGDNTVFIDRTGRVAGGIIFERMKTDESAIIANRIFDLQLAHHFHRIFIDVGFNGKDVFDLLVGRGLVNVLTGVSFAGEAYDKETYKNKRAEIYDLTAKWFRTPGGVRVPDDNTFHKQVTAIRRKPTSEKRILMLDKEQIRKEFKFSPDDFDALATTFAEKVVAPEAMGARRRSHRQTRGRSFMSG